MQTIKSKEVEITLEWKDLKDEVKKEMCLRLGISEEELIRQREVKGFGIVPIGNFSVITEKEIVDDKLY